MRILLTSHQFPPKGTFGTEKLTFECARELQSRGHEAYVLTTEPASAELSPDQSHDYEYRGLKVRTVGTALGEAPDPLRYEFDNPAMAEHMRRYIRQVTPDLVHVWHAARLSGSIIRVAKELGVPVVFTATDFWSVCRVIHLRRADTGQLCLGPDRHGVNCLRCYIARTNAPQRKKETYLRKPDAELRAWMALAKRPVLRRAERAKPLREVPARIAILRDIINSADRVIAPTKLTRDLLLRNGIDPGLLVVSRYGIDHEHISGIPRSPASPAVMRFGFMGALARHKGVHTLLKAFRGIPETAPAELKVYGNLRRDPIYSAELEALAATDRRIEFKAPFEADRVGEVLAELDVLVVPSAWYENTPLVVYEAFASGTPVVATDLGGLSEVIEHEKNGLLFEVDDVKELSSQLQRFLTEPDLLSDLRAGIKPIRTVEDSVAELERLYLELVEARTPVEAAHQS